MPFLGTCDNTEKLSPCSFIVFDAKGRPAKLDTVNDTLRGTATGGGAINLLPESVFTNPDTGIAQPQYNFELVSGDQETETIEISLDCDGQPGPGVIAFHDQGTLQVAPASADAASFVLGPAVPKNAPARRR